VRTRERAVLALEERLEQEQFELEEGTTSPAAPEAKLDQQPNSNEIVSRLSVDGYGRPGYVGQGWAEGGIGVEAAWWARLPSPWPRDAG
jgi:hypothetical protein